MDAVQDMGMSTVSYPAPLENEKRFTASLETLVPVRAKRLTFEQVTKVEKVTTVSFEGDPYHEYLQCSEDRRETWLFKTVISLSRTVFLYEHVRQKTGWTLDEGDALICYSDPAKPASRAYKIVNAAVQRLALFVLSKEQTKRFKESQDKLGAAVKELLEEHGEDMFSIDLLACTPAKQGRGYGTILGRFVTAEADSRALKTYVVSSNVNANTVFYNNLGFFTAKTIVLGDKNPKWRKPPVRLDVPPPQLKVSTTICRFPFRAIIDLITDAAQDSADRDSDMVSRSSLLGRTHGMHVAAVETLVPAQPKKLAFEHLSKTGEVTTAVLETDPLNKYLVFTEDRRTGWFHRVVPDFIRDLYMSEFVRQKTAWTLDEGDAFVCYGFSLFSSDPAKAPSRWFTFVQPIVARLQPYFQSPEQNKRLKEIQTKLRPAMREVMQTHKEMFCIEHVACTPEKQGHGYGTTLCKLVTAEADLRSLETYLVSGNVEANTRFYNNLGFFAVKTIVLGDDNPTWKNAPIKVDIMVREVPPADSEKAAIRDD
ncbi:hypothetical protein EUX98_g2865 [Antrodiella citrinella]|uniref:N-acetyltransferase domain-containing protein n=1 Tax=Antrodiella citrinella TaxID=2447956 RepID=A0A4S4MXW4_9APHY|nr:hypothetical protein EUX98_g2865 [Antrodiella citrinella]